MGLFIANNAFFIHAHKLNNGKVIEHAHPYNKTSDSKPYKSHHHSNTEYFFFQNFEILFLIVFIIYVLKVYAKEEKIWLALLSVHILFHSTIHKGRAPPVSYLQDLFV